jgi:hypothetical protein
MRQRALDLLKAECAAKVRDAWARVALGLEHIRQQEQRVLQQKMRGSDARDSEALLATFRETQTLNELSCERLLQELHALDVATHDHS